MKVLDKIVSGDTAPRQTGVMWLDSLTNTLNVFGINGLWLPISGAVIPITFAEIDTLFGDYYYGAEFSLEFGNGVGVGVWEE